MEKESKARVLLWIVWLSSAGMVVTPIGVLILLSSKRIVDFGWQDMLAVFCSLAFFGGVSVAAIYQWAFVVQGKHMSIEAKKKLLQLASVALTFIGFVIGPVGFGFWAKAYPDRSIGLPLLLVVVNLVVCALVILAIADYWEVLRKQEKGE